MPINKIQRAPGPDAEYPKEIRADGAWGGHEFRLEPF